MALKVLIVDDATFIRDMVKRAMRQIAPEAELFEAIDGNRAVALIKQKTPDVILSDWEMPEMGGDELLKWVRAQPDSLTTPFIMITSRGDRNHVLEAVNAGVSDYISKPFTQEELHRKIHKQLKRIGYQAKGPTAAASAGGGAFSSLAVLTGATAAPKTAPPAAANTEAEAAAKPKAYVRFSDEATACEVRELSLQGLSGVLKRPKILPSLFAQAVVDVANAQGEVAVSINGYVSLLAAVNNQPDASLVRINLRFVDQDPTKLEVLSRLIG